MRGPGARRRSCWKSSASRSMSRQRVRRCRSPTSRWSRSRAPWCTCQTAGAGRADSRDRRARGRAAVRSAAPPARRAACRCIFISHRLDEVFAICDRVTVLKDGRLVGTHDVADVTRERLISMMVGRDLGDLFPPRAGRVADGEPVLRTEAVAVGDRVRDVSIELRAGEIVALAGMVGAGRSELALACSARCRSRAARSISKASASPRCRRRGHPARDGPRHRGSQVAGARDAARYRGQHHRPRACRGHAARSDRSALEAAIAAARDRALPHRLPWPCDRGRHHVRRQPAEGHRRALGARYAGAC